MLRCLPSELDLLALRILERVGDSRWCLGGMYGPWATAARAPPPNRLPPFGGTQKENVDEWIAAMDMAFGYHVMGTRGWTEAARISHAATYFTISSAALKWWLSDRLHMHPGDPTGGCGTFSNFLEVVAARWRKKTLVTQAATQLRTLTQGSRTVEEYSEKYDSLLLDAQRGYVPDKLKRDDYVLGLNTDVRTLVSVETGKNPDAWTYAATRQFAIQMDGVLRQSARKAPESGGSSGGGQPVQSRSFASRGRSGWRGRGSGRGNGFGRGNGAGRGTQPFSSGGGNRGGRGGRIGPSGRSRPYRQRSTPNDPSKFPGSCHVCGGKGHWARECPQSTKGSGKGPAAPKGGGFQSN